MKRWGAGNGYDVTNYGINVRKGRPVFLWLERACIYNMAGVCVGSNIQIRMLNIFFY